MLFLAILYYKMREWLAQARTQLENWGLTRPVGQSRAGFSQPEITGFFRPDPNPALPEKCSGLLSTWAGTGTTRLTVGTLEHDGGTSSTFRHVYLYFVYMFVCVILLNICVCMSNNYKYKCIHVHTYTIYFFPWKFNLIKIYFLRVGWSWWAFMGPTRLTSLQAMHRLVL
jgi:hypothetical protein